MIPHNYPAADNWMRKLVMGASGPSEVVPPPLEVLRARDENGGFHVDGHSLVRQMMEPPRPEPTMDEASRRHLKEYAPRFGESEEITQLAIQVQQKYLAVYAEGQELEKMRSETKKTALRVEWEQVYQLCRQARDRVVTLERNNGGLQSQIHAIGERQSKARAALNEVFSHRPAPDTYPTAAEFSAWQTQVDAARIALREVEQDYAVEQRALATLTEEIREALKTFTELQAREADLKAQLDGGERRMHGVLLSE